MSTKAKWKGGKPGDDGYEFIAGIPAHDLSDDDYAALSTDQKKTVRDSSLYDYQSDSRSSSSSSASSSGGSSSRAASEEAKS